MLLEERLDRQLRIDGWDQHVLSSSKIGVIGDDDLLASMFILSASALGINRLVTISPRLERNLLETASKINPQLNLVAVEGYYSHPILDDILTGCDVLIDLSRFGLANKLLLEKGYRENLPVIRGFLFDGGDEEGLAVFTYLRGREWQELSRIVSPRNIPHTHSDDGVLDIVTAGIVLEEVKNVLMVRRTSEEIITYTRRKPTRLSKDGSICVVGAGALGNFTVLGLAYSGFKNITILDPDVAEVVNLNRQVFLYEAIGLGKAKTLSERINAMFGPVSRFQTGYFEAGTDLSTYDAVFDCVDNFETRILLSERCKEQGKVLVSGGTDVEAGQVVIFHPQKGGPTPAELLGLYDIVEERKLDPYIRDRASCTYRPDPSVIMTNQIIAGLMVDSYRKLLDGQEPQNLFYDSTRDKRL